MIRRLFRTLAGWCWAMYLVALIVWIVALVASFVVELHSGFSWSSWSDLSASSLIDGKFEMQLWGPDPRSSDFDPYEIVFPGFEFKSDQGPVAVLAGGPVFLPAYQLRIDSWLTTFVLVTPVLTAAIGGVLRNRRVGAIPRSRSGAVVGLLFRLTVGAALWATGGLVALLITSDERVPAIGFDIETRNDIVVTFGAEVRKGSLVLGGGHGGLHDDDFEVQRAFRTFSRLGIPPNAPEVTCPLWAVFMLLAIAPLAALIAGLRRVPFPPGCCRACGYDLRGSPGGDGPAKCPECGWSGAAS